MIDSAMLRPGRLDKLLYVPLPSPEERVDILKTCLRHTPVDSSVEIARLATSERCNGFRQVPHRELAFQIKKYPPDHRNVYRTNLLNIVVELTLRRLSVRRQQKHCAKTLKTKTQAILSSRTRTLKSR